MNNTNRRRSIVFLHMIILLVLVVGQLTIAASTYIINDEPSTSKIIDLERIIVAPGAINFTGAFAPKDTGFQTRPYSHTVILVDLDRNMSTGTQYSLVGRGYSGLYEPIVPGVDIAISSYYDPSYPYIGIQMYPPGTDGYTRYLDAGNMVGVETDNSTWIRYDINWNNLLIAYGEFFNSYPTPPYTLYLVSTREGYSVNNHAFSWDSFYYDYINVTGQIFTMEQATITLDGNDSDWPTGTTIAVDDPTEDPSPVNGTVDIRSLMMAADQQYLYIGVRLGDILDKNTIFNDPDLLYTGYQLTLDLLINDTYRIEMYLTLNEQGSRYTLRTTTYAFGDLLNATGDIVEFAIPQNVLQDNFGFQITPGATVEFMANVSWTSGGVDFLSTGDLNTTIYQFLINPENNTVTYTGYIKSYKILFSSSQTSATVGNLTITVPGVIYSTTAILSESPTIPIPAKINTKGDPIGYYYFTIENPSYIQWPITVTIKYSDLSGNDIKPFYYSKTSNKYIEIPESFYTIDKGAKTITINYTLELYNDGDPSIVIMSVPSTVGGGLVNDTTSMIETIIPILIAGILLLATISLIIERRN